MRDLVALPKAHLHVHLESAIRPRTLRDIGAANGVPVPPARDGDRSGFAGFGAFADHNARVRACLRTASDFRRIAREFCQDEAEQGNRYVEVTFTAAAHGERVGDPRMPLAAVLDGLAEGRQEYGIECRVLLDHSRRRSVARAWQTLDLAVRYAADGVVGIGLAGDESHPLRPFAAVCDAARDAGLHLVHHAGECAGPVSVREALYLGHAQRLGHGIRALDDPDLTAELRARAVPLEVCPTSNVALGLVASVAEHPLPALREAGLVVTLNTDIPAVTGTTLVHEYRLARDVFGYQDAVLAQFARASVDASFAPAHLKEQLRREITDWLGFVPP